MSISASRSLYVLGQDMHASINDDNVAARMKMLRRCLQNPIPGIPICATSHNRPVASVKNRLNQYQPSLSVYRRTTCTVMFTSASSVTPRVRNRRRHVISLRQRRYGSPCHTLRISIGNRISIQKPSHKLSPFRRILHCTTLACPSEP